mmetsp:Transcript_7358/g.11621  ORF Transcript_7358/g.11621 Transcript_7358/m.11621 type:complete len:249 (+) Transcript_7358:1206-1952(+)
MALGMPCFTTLRYRARSPKRRSSSVMSASMLRSIPSMNLTTPFTGWPTTPTRPVPTPLKKPFTPCFCASLTGSVNTPKAPFRTPLPSPAMPRRNCLPMKVFDRLRFLLRRYDVEGAADEDFLSSDSPATLSVRSATACKGAFTTPVMACPMPLSMPTAPWSFAPLTGFDTIPATPENTPMGTPAMPFPIPLKYFAVDFRRLNLSVEFGSLSRLPTALRTDEGDVRSGSMLLFFFFFFFFFFSRLFLVF